MIWEILFRYLHFIGLFVWVSMLLGEALLLQDHLPRRTIARLARLELTALLH